MNPLEELLDLLRRKMEGLEVGAEELAQAVLKDSGELMVRKLQGDDVDEELAHVRAQALNLSVAAQELIRQSIAEWLMDQAARLLQRVL